MDRLERLVNLVVALMDTPRPLTREELRQRVGGYSDDEDNFHRNFERDKDSLRQMGIPLVTALLDPNVPESGTGYRIPRSLYELPDPGLDDDELMAFFAAVRAVALEGAEPGVVTDGLVETGRGERRPGGTSAWSRRRTYGRGKPAIPWRWFRGARPGTADWPGGPRRGRSTFGRAGRPTGRRRRR